MPTPLLTTKFFVPAARPERVPRPRLVERLDGGLARGHRLTLVSAPAGSGKTTLLSDWLGRRDGPAAWLSLDEQDNEFARFWTYLIGALQTARAGLGHSTLDSLRSLPLAATPVLLTPLANELAALPEMLTLVLDDYHLISAPRIHDGLAFLLEHPAHNLHLVIATRADPPLPLFRLRARGQLTELRLDDLRFTPGEAADFLSAVMDLDLAPEDVKTLQARTEGWAVGLQLAALALQGTLARSPGGSAHEFIAAFGGSHHYVLEYLTEEVVRRQTGPTRDFLVRTCILDRLCGSLCDAVTGEEDGDAVLADLQRRNLFLIPLDGQHHWYRYHHLFADLLTNMQRKEQTPEQIRELHRRASGWHARQGNLDEAIEHALKGGDLEGAASLIEEAAQTVISHGRLATLLRWLAALPEAMLEARPRLRLYQGWALNLSGQIDAAGQILAETRDRLERLPPSAANRALRGRLAALLAGIATTREEPRTVIREAREALAFLPEEDRISRARLLMALGTAHAYEDRPERAAGTW